MKRSSSTPAKKKLGRVLLIVVCALAALLLLSFLLSRWYASLRSGRPEKAPEKNYVNFYEPDFDADIFEDEDYLKTDRHLYYTAGGVRIVLDEYDDSELTEGQRFFVRYFDAVTHGDCDAYHAFFAPEYGKDGDEHEDDPTGRVFTMQKLYDISVTELARAVPEETSYVYQGHTVIFGVYSVSYKLLHNDGTFRVDLPENGEIPVVFELVTTDAGTPDEKTLIRHMYRYDDIEERTQAS